MVPQKNAVMYIYVLSLYNINQNYYDQFDKVSSYNEKVEIYKVHLE